MASLVNKHGQPVSGQLSYPVHAKVIENDSDDYKGHVRLKLKGMAPDGPRSRDTVGTTAHPNGRQ